MKVLISIADVGSCIITLDQDPQQPVAIETLTQALRDKDREDLASALEAEPSLSPWYEETSE